MGNMNVTVIDQNNVNIAVTPTPTQTINIDRGIIGVSGLSGYSGYSGYSGIGSSGYSGLSGFSGYSGISGWSGESGTSGYSGYSGIGESGYSGFSGYSGDSGISGYSGDSGLSGYSGESGISGYSGFSGQQGTSINVKGEVPTVGDLPPTGNQVNDAYIVTEDGNLWVWNGSAWYDAGQIVGPQGLSGFSGYSGESGYSGFSGDSGISGWSGESGISGFSGDSGISGWSGFSGESGYSGLNGDSGYSGISGYSGFSGDSGISGWSGISGYSGSGISGWSGFSGYSGISGQDGASGFSGYSGISGYSGSGISGYSGYSGIGTSGYSGFSGYSGYSGAVGAGGAIGNWGSFWDTTTQTTTINTPTAITFNSYDLDNTGVSIGSPTSRIVFANSGTYSLTFSIQFTNTSTANGATQIWLKKNGTNIPDTNSHFDVPDKQGSAFSSEILTVNFVFNVTANDYVQLYWDTTNASVSLETIAGNGTYPRTPSVIFTATQVMYGQSGYSGISGYSGYSGFSGISGFSGESGISGYSGSGVSGWSGASGYSGYSGEVGTSGYSGYSGISGINGASGFSGISGYSGYSGIDGASGFSGYSGISGYSGSGVSGYSGFSGISGYSGYSGITPTIGGSNTQVQYNNSGVLGGSANFTFDGSTTVSLNGQINLGNNNYIGFKNNGASVTASIFQDTSNYLNLYNSGNTGTIFYANAGERLRLTSTSLYTASGVNVGIGVSNPTAKLTIEGTAGVLTDVSTIEPLYINAPTTTTGSGAGIRFNVLSGAKQSVGIIGVVNNATGDLGSMVFHVYNNGETIPEYMRLTNSGNLAIGTTTAVTRLTLANPDDTTNGQLRYARSVDPTYYWETGRDNQNTGNFIFSNATGGAKTSILTLTSSGNLGLGVTPSAWFSIDKALQFGGTFSGTTHASALTSQTNDAVTTLWNNAYRNASVVETYFATGEASKYRMYRNAHEWYIAPSGTAGNPITFTQAMTLNANGDLVIGGTTPDVFANTFERNFGVVALTANSTASINVSGTVASRIQFGTGSTRYGIIYQDASNFMQIGTTTALPISFVTNSTEKMRIASNGDVTIGNAVASTNVNLILNGVTSKAQRIYFNTSGVDKWLLGQGAATETDAFEIYNANGQMALTFAKATSNATFGGNIIVSPVTTTNSAYLLNSNASGNFFFAIDSSTGASFTGTAYGRAIYSGGAYPMVFLTNDTERMRITSAGKTIIGSDNTVGAGGDAQLTVNGNSLVVTPNTAGKDTHVLTTGTANYGTYAIKGDTVTKVYLNTNGDSYLNGGNLVIGDTSQLFSGKVGIKFNGNGTNGISMQTTYAGSGDAYLNFVNESGTQIGYIYRPTSSTVAFVSTSDHRLKENIVNAPSFLSIINNLQVRQYNWKENGETEIGFIAQELHTKLPKTVAVGIDNKDGSINRPWGIDKTAIIPYLVKAIQEQQTLIESLTTRLTALENK